MVSYTLTGGGETGEKTTTSQFVSSLGYTILSPAFQASHERLEKVGGAEGRRHGQETHDELQGQVSE